MEQLLKLYLFNIINKSRLNYKYCDTEKKKGFFSPTQPQDALFF